MRLTTLILTGILAITACTTAGDASALRDREWKLSWIDGFASPPAGVAAASGSPTTPSSSSTTPAASWRASSEP